jgi:hypothetical protein
MSNIALSPRAMAATEVLRRWRPQRLGCCAPTQPRSKRYGV